MVNNIINHYSAEWLLVMAVFFTLFVHVASFIDKAVLNSQIDCSLPRTFAYDLFKDKFHNIRFFFFLKLNLRGYNIVLIGWGAVIGFIVSVLFFLQAFNF